MMRYFDHYIRPELIAIVVDQTYLYAQQQIAKMPHPVTKHAWSGEWKPVTVIETKKKNPWFDFCKWCSPKTKISIVNMVQLLALFYVIKIFIYIIPNDRPQHNNTTTLCRIINRTHKDMT